MERSLEFLEQLVGLPVLQREKSFSFLDGGSVRIGLNEVAERQHAESDTEIVLVVEEPEEVYAAMAQRGVPFEIELRPVVEHEGRRLVAAHFRDPDGHLWSVTGWVT